MNPVAFLILFFLFPSECGFLLFGWLGRFVLIWGLSFSSFLGVVRDVRVRVLLRVVRV